MAFIQRYPVQTVYQDFQKDFIDKLHILGMQYISDKEELYV